MAKLTRMQRLVAQARANFVATTLAGLVITAIATWAFLAIFYPPPRLVLHFTTHSALRDPHPHIKNKILLFTTANGKGILSIADLGDRTLDLQGGDSAAYAPFLFACNQCVQYGVKIKNVSDKPSGRIVVILISTGPLKLISTSFDKAVIDHSCGSNFDKFDCQVIISNIPAKGSTFFAAFEDGPESNGIKKVSCEGDMGSGIYCTLHYRDIKIVDISAISKFTIEGNPAEYPPISMSPVPLMYIYDPPTRSWIYASEHPPSLAASGERILSTPPAAGLMPGPER